MDILIRDINPTAVKCIDELAKKKGISRSAYVKEMIEAKATLSGVEEKTTRYDTLVQNCISIISDNNILLEQLKLTLERSDL